MSRRLPPPWQLKRTAYRVAPLPQIKDAPRYPRVWPGIAMVVETVRSDGLAGPAPFGCYLLVRGQRVLGRGLFLGPTATASDDRMLSGVSRSLGLEEVAPLECFLDLLYRYIYKYRLPLVAFEPAVHLASVAADWTAPAAGGHFEGGVSLILWTNLVSPGRGEQRLLRNGTYENGYRPRVLCKVLADGSVNLAFSGRRDPDWIDCVSEDESIAYGRHFVSVERLYRALTGQRARTLDEACSALAIEGPPESQSDPAADPKGAAMACLGRAEAVHRLYLELLEKHSSFKLRLPPDQVFSAASYAKATLDAVGITPPAHRYKGDLLGIGAAMCAAYGGWSGLGARSTPDSPPLPVRIIDVAAEYAVCAHKIGIWDLLTSERLTMDSLEPAQIEQWISRQRLDSFLPSPELCVFCRLRPDGAVLPHRIRPGASWLTTVAPLYCEQSLWWPLSDLVNSFFETGTVPQLDAALRLVGHGRLKNLQPIELPGLGEFDPNAEAADLFLFLAQGRQLLDRGETDLDGRQRAWLASLYKLWDNSACSGIFLEVHPQEPTKRLRPGTVIGPDGPYQTKAHAFEEPGRWFFPPFYSLVTAAGRLLLSLAMHEVRVVGGCVVYWDTDSLAILATPTGGLVPAAGGRHLDRHGQQYERALSHDEVDAIRWALERHSPYQCIGAR